MPDPGVHLISHPLVQHLLTDLRDRGTPPLRFRQVMETMGTLLCYEAIRAAELAEHDVDTPLEAMRAPRLARRVTLVPILRAGLGLTNGMMRLLPDAQVGHIGMFRDEQKLSPVSYYEKLPPTVAAGPVLLCDPMLATGGSAVAGVDLLKTRGCQSIRFVGVLAAPAGLAKLRDAHPDVPVTLAAVDRELDDRGYILPGLGDAGDRVFGTV